uniref:Chromophore lyase CpcS/CpeS 1 n=1 Tax=Paulinella chromatophora TaxID=39717 RepID=CPXS1_PAUCH|nr:hypothetical protein PCC_0138 [Paulinella chromatophora]B1X3S1.1 RecName: Full=Chromophore lyase CpcS/CpeS 1 [Paulinella chromatophora]ACB42590.1 hypothetical protein PCC_0138 [Paulinella chromatophora]
MYGYPVTTVFPPVSIEDFLSLSIGHWISLRSQFKCSSIDDNWHSSERGDIKLALGPSDNSNTRNLAISMGSQYAMKLEFFLDGRLQSENCIIGTWQIWPDGSLELSYHDANGNEQCERIWFMKTNLRLRSTVAFNQDGTLRQASFCSEIRRVTKHKL